MRKKRIDLTVTEPQLEFMRQLANDLGIGMPELMRRIIDTHRFKQIAGSRPPTLDPKTGEIRAGGGGWGLGNNQESSIGPPVEMPDGFEGDTIVQLYKNGHEVALRGPLALTEWLKNLSGDDYIVLEPYLDELCATAKGIAI